jgi:probable rRNA maturation factor
MRWFSGSLPRTKNTAANPAPSVSKRVRVRNRQRALAIDRTFFQKIIQQLLLEILEVDRFDLHIYIVGEIEMTALNEGFLRHRGSTDVLAFDYREPGADQGLIGEIFVCADEAVNQARRYRTSWQSELVRYAIHGILHLLGYDDHAAARRREMKSRENQALRTLSRIHNLAAVKARSGR